MPLPAAFSHLTSVGLIEFYGCARLYIVCVGHVAAAFSLMVFDVYDDGLERTTHNHTQEGDGGAGQVGGRALPATRFRRGKMRRCAVLFLVKSVSPTHPLNYDTNSFPYTRTSPPQIDFSFNKLSATDVVSVVNHTNHLLVDSFPAHPSLFLNMRQFTRRFKSRYRELSTWMVTLKELRTFLASVRVCVVMFASCIHAHSKIHRPFINTALSPR